MKADRSGSQILHGYLPHQTVDLHGGVWKVTEWRTPRFVKADLDALRREVIRLAGPWEATRSDSGFVKRMRENRALRVHGLDLNNGIMVERFPRTWQCRSCRRLRDSIASACKCGATNWGQLHFVGYHKCGLIEEPWIPRCKAHDEVRINFPGSSDARQIRFDCPVCHQTLRQGFGFRKCDCGDGQIAFNVHRASSVFTPRSVAVVNAPSEELWANLKAAGGAERALAWVVDGMPRGGLTETAFGRSALIKDLVAKGFDPTTAERMADVAGVSGGLTTDISLVELGHGAQTALDHAVTIFNATAESRSTIEDLIEGTRETSVLGSRYRSRYLLSMHRAGFSAIELAESFPILTGYYGYTRGDQQPGAASLRTWRDRRSGSYVIYGELNKTEALFFRLDPFRVTDWLRSQGHDLPQVTDERDARISLLERAEIPTAGEEVEQPTIGSDLLTLVHSMSHRLIRQTAVLAGIDRNSLAELLIPTHLAFFVYAGARGDFVLGGLQALFETELDRLIDSFISGEHRCALDPGCTKTGGACMACLHLGEPSCRYFNRFLDRRALVGARGYLQTLSSSIGAGSHQGS